MTNVDRSLRAARTSPLTGRNRRRFHAITAGVALAFITGVSAPAFAGTASHANSVPAESMATTAVATLTGQASTSSYTASLTAAKAATASAKPATVTKATAAKAAAPTNKQLHPTAIAGGQESFKLSKEQLRNAREIVKAGQKMKLPPRAMVIAVATAMQESKLQNLGNLGASNDHDSLGLFQQRPSSGWGTPAQVTDPQHATTSFLKALVNVDGWQSMPLSDAAQAVQVSAFPDAYAQWEKQAGDIVLGMYGSGPYAAQVAALK